MWLHQKRMLSEEVYHLHRSIEHVWNFRIWIIPVSQKKFIRANICSKESNVWSKFHSLKKSVGKNFIPKYDLSRLQVNEGSYQAFGR